jgi:heat shock protein HspQ
MFRNVDEGGVPSHDRAFEPGRLVRHRRYGYRGVVVSADKSCQAPDAWYGHNKTQPDRDQPWYHVFVHGSGGSTTYAAHTSLEADRSADSIDHPLVEHFFSGFSDGRYKRNDEPWPEWDG